MGLLDVLNGMQNGPRGSSDGKGGMSPLTMALLALLAYKAVKHINTGGAATSAPAPAPSGGTVASGGGLGGLLGGLLAGGAAGSVLSGGLGDLMKQFQQSGQGEAANSWVSQGENKAIAPGDLSKALGEEQIGTLMQQSGLSRDELLSGLSRLLPDAVNHLTPNGRLPDEHEASRLI